VDIFYTGIGRSVIFSLNIQSKEERSVKEEFCTTGISGSRKSDNNIVPEKPSNKEVKTFAEQVEGKAAWWKSSGWLFLKPPFLVSKSSL
jgi:hypothetical protein